ncbi:MAG: ParB N-terminal domain-containing protein [Olsenella sp.]|nr:ParB N-terminal domain-containing protein [Olsenella sp.]
MLVDIDKIIVGDRIRRDFGDIQELADDIKQNTLLNALVVTPNGEGTYLLIAGERRLRACKMLGYKAVTVNSVGVEDAERALRMEISENECRKEFTMTERLAYADKLQAIKAAEANARMLAGKANPTPNSAEGQKGETRDAVASAIGMGHETLRQARIIADNADLLDPADFADWDEGKLSTNKAFQRIKAAQKQAEQERNAANERVAGLQSDLADALQEIEALERQNDQLYDLTQQQQVVEHEVVREVIPEEYKDAKRRARELESGNRMYSEENAKLRDQLAEAQRQIESMSGNDQLTEAKKELAAFAWKYRGVDQLSELVAMIDHFLDN